MREVRLYFVILFCLLGLSNLKAQDNVFHMGVSAFALGTQVSGDNLAGYDKAGFLVGPFVGLELNDSWQARMEIVYVTKGSRKRPQPLKGDYSEYRMHLGYVEVPLLVLYSWNKFQVELGPSIGLLVNSSEADQNGTYTITRPFHQMEWSFNAGLHYPIKENLSFIVRTNNSIWHIREHAGNGVFRFNRGQYSSVLGLGIAFKFKG